MTQGGRYARCELPRYSIYSALKLTRMPSSKRKRESVFSTSYNPPNLRRRFQAGHDEENRPPQGNYSPNRPSRTPFPDSQRLQTDSYARASDRGHPEQVHEQDVDDDLEQVVMAIDIKERGTVGCCYYVAQEERLYILGDVQLGGKEVIETCLCSLSV